MKQRIAKMFRTPYYIDVAGSSYGFQRLTDAITRLGQIYGRETAKSAGAERLSTLQARILRDLGESECSISHFARTYSVTSATVSDSIRVLAERQLVTKRRDPNDARSILVSATKQGQEAADATTTWIGRIQAVLAELGQDEQEQMYGSLTALIEAIDRASGIERSCERCYHLAINCDADAASAPHFCRFYHLPLREAELRTDCPDFAESRTH